MIKRFRVYYDFQPDKGRPLASPKSPEEVERALELFPQEFEVNFRPDGVVTVESTDTDADSIVIKVERLEEPPRFYEIMKYHLNDWHLFAEELDK